MEAIIIITDIVEKLILLTMFALSIWSISIMIDRKKVLKSLELENDFFSIKNFLINQKSNETLIENLKSYVAKNQNYFSTAIQQWLSLPPQSENIDRSTLAIIKEERIKFEKGLAVLATLGSNAPFVGLFGTVLGIIRAFAYLGSQTGSTAVMSGVSQALYATALGLFVAIPAIIAYNVFVQKIKKANSQLETLKDLYIAHTIKER